jgi:hypothetical protein
MLNCDAEFKEHNGKIFKPFVSKIENSAEVH